jgi:hypothetical protein
MNFKGMNDLTQGSIPKHLINMAIPMMAGVFYKRYTFLLPSILLVN